MNKTKQKTYLSIFIIAILVLSVFGFVLSSSTGNSSTRYNGQKFEKINNQYLTKIDGLEYTFYYHPTELEHVTDLELQKFFETPVITITFDPNTSSQEYMELARFSLTQTLNKKGTIVNPGIMKENKNYNLPLAQCNGQPTIQIEEGDNNIELKDNCLKITSEGINLIQQTERVQYSALGIMP